jgi:hypothetical protein
LGLDEKIVHGYIISTYKIDIRNMQVDITFNFPNLIDKVPSHAKGA